MAVETSTTINGLNEAWPLGSDLRSEGDNHLRLIKSTLKAVFDDSGATIKTTKPVESPAGAKLGAVTITGATTVVGDFTMTGQFTLKPTADATKLFQIDQSRQLTATTRKFYLPAAAIDTVAGIWEPIADVNFSGVAQYDVKDLAPFKRLRLMGSAAPVAAGALSFRTSSDNGVTFYTNVSDYSYTYMLSASTAVTGNTAGSVFGFLTSNTDAGTVGHFEHAFENFNVAGGDKSVKGQSKQRSTSLTGTVWNQAINQAAAMNALRITCSVATNITGTFILEGQRG